jgi:predicted HTH domain antitoxin
MQITIDLPDELVQHFNRNHLTREILEVLVVQAYQTEKITSAQVRRILGLPSRWAVDAFLKQHNANLHYDEADLERDRAGLPAVGWRLAIALECLQSLGLGYRGFLVPCSCVPARSKSGGFLRRGW